MNKKLFWALFILIILFGFLIRVIPTLGNNFYFTMDQGDDAVHVREILVRHQIPILGPPTGLEGLFAGPLWYYFISIGYLIFGGNPFGSVFMLILLNLGLTAVLMKILAKKISLSFALIT
ncbi:MAG: hypothetical protein Q8P10_00680, partial [bacterium]|nr:hypothetical protein [bacterium]